MSEEEKKAIEILKQEPDYSLSYYKREKAIDIVLNLINKQQKQIDRFKKDKDILYGVIDELKEEVKRQGNTREIEEKFVEDNFISKNKIRELLNKDVGQYMKFYRDIEELLEE